jgi:hypothetical protein
MTERKACAFVLAALALMCVTAVAVLSAAVTAYPQGDPTRDAMTNAFLALCGVFAVAAVAAIAFYSKKE